MIYRIDPHTEAILEEFRTYDAVEMAGYSRSAVWHCIHGNRGTHRGFVWQTENSTYRPKRKRANIRFNCEWCHKEVTRGLSSYTCSYKHYCSKQCAGESRRKKC